MNICEFANICGVSNGTVSNCFANPQKVKAKTLERIRCLVDQRVDGIMMIDPGRKLKEEEKHEFQLGNIPCVYIETRETSAED